MKPFYPEFVVRFPAQDIPKALATVQRALEDDVPTAAGPAAVHWCLMKQQAGHDTEAAAPHCGAERAYRGVLGAP